MQLEPRLLPIVEGKISPPPYEESPPTLVGGRCRSCGQVFFPRPNYCRNCLETTQDTDLGGKGTVYGYTIIRVNPPFGLKSPYAVGYIDLEGSGLRIFGLFDPECIELLEIGAQVKLKVGPMGVDSRGEACLRPYFTIDHEARKGSEA